MKHKYFVSFVFNRNDGFGQETGSGNNIVECGFAIETFEDVLAIQEELEKKSDPPYKKVLLTNFIHLGSEQLEEGETVEGGVILN